MAVVVSVEAGKNAKGRSVAGTRCDRGADLVFFAAAVVIGVSAAIGVVVLATARVRAWGAIQAEAEGVKNIAAVLVAATIEIEGREEKRRFEQTKPRPKPKQKSFATFGEPRPTKKLASSGLQLQEVWVRRAVVRWEVMGLSAPILPSSQHRKMSAWQPVTSITAEVIEDGGK